VAVALPPNAPRQPRRWQRCGARRAMARESYKSRAQVRGRASGVVLHAVVRRPGWLERIILILNCLGTPLFTRHISTAALVPKLELRFTASLHSAQFRK